MMQLPIVNAVYTSLTQEIPVLQQLQTLTDTPRTTTVAEVIALLSAMQQEYGSGVTLEQIIQHRVGLQLQAQRDARKLLKEVAV